MDFTLDKLIRHPIRKESQKKKRDDSRANKKEKSIVAVNGASALLEGVSKKTLGVLVIEPEVNVPIEEAEVAPPILMDVKTMGTTSNFALPILPIRVRRRCKQSNSWWLHYW